MSQLNVVNEFFLSSGYEAEDDSWVRSGRSADGHLLHQIGIRWQAVRLFVQQHWRMQRVDDQSCGAGDSGYRRTRWPPDAKVFLDSSARRAYADDTNWNLLIVLFVCFFFFFFSPTAVGRRFSSAFPTLRNRWRTICLIKGLPRPF